jgi:dTDP-4-amino-4,6-dideoxygalactose transaminase
VRAIEGAAGHAGKVRFVALERQHAHFQQELNPFVGPLGTSGVPEDSFPAAEARAAEELSLPMHPDVTADEVQCVASTVNSVAAYPTARSGEARC